MSLDLAQKALQLFDDDLDVPVAKTTKNARQERKKKESSKKSKKVEKERTPEDLAATRAEQLLRSTLVSRLKTPKILDKVIRQQKNRSSFQTRRLESSTKRSVPSRTAIASSAAFEGKSVEKLEEEDKPEEAKNTVFTEEDFQKFFETYKPTKPI